MSARFNSRVLAALVSSALVIGSIAATTPAFAEDVVEPTPTSTEVPVEAPAEEPAEQPAEEPAEQPAQEPGESPAEEPTEEPTEVPAEEPTEAPAGELTSGTTTIEYAGSVTLVSDAPDEAAAAASDIQLFHVSGFGYLTLDFSGVSVETPPNAPINVTLKVPAGLDLGADDESAFAAIAEHANTVAPLDVTKAKPGNIAGRVTVTPISTAVHKIYAVPVTPGGKAGTAPTAGQSQANIAASVAASDAYWRGQSNQQVGFTLAATASWYKSSLSCDSDVVVGRFAAIMNEASAVAASQIGYVDAPNNHLVLFFPSQASASDLYCGQAIGRGSLGGSVNDSGHLWAIGTQTADEKATLAHELGHNISLMHSNWLNCPTAAPNPGLSGSACTSYEYGDRVDVMGYGIAGVVGGMISSPHAIRSGLWPTTAYTNVPTGTNQQYTLQAMSTNAGMRALVIEGNNGVNYFVEYRNNTGLDTGYTSAGCAINGSQGACAPTAPGIRILRMGNQYGYKSYSPNPSQLIGRTEAGVPKTNYVTGQTFTLDGVAVTVTAVAGATATVTVSRTVGSPAAGSVDIYRVYTDNPITEKDGSWHAGDTLTAMLGTSWRADSYTYQWFRQGVAIAGATQANYTLTGDDVGKSTRVQVKGTLNGVSTGLVTDPSLAYIGYQPNLAGVVRAGSLAINASTLPFTVTKADWTVGVTYAHQWLRDGVAISGATAATYTPTAADNGKTISVRVTGTKSGFTSAAKTSAAKNYTLTAGAVPAISGTFKVGTTLTAGAQSYSTVDGAVTPTRTFQWYRAGVAITGATAATYALVAADLAKAITVSVTAKAPGYASNVSTSAATGAIQPGDIQGSKAVPTVAVVLTLDATLTLPAGSITETGVTYAYSWWRDGVAITGATAATYKLTTADYGKLVKARVKVTKTGYATLDLDSVAKNYSVIAGSLPVITGTAKVGQVLTAQNVTYSTSAGVVASPTRTYQWLRAGVAIAGATGSTYALVAADWNTLISVRVTGATPNFLTATGTSVATTAVAKGDIQASGTPVVTIDSAMLATVAMPAGSVTESGVTYSYQWLRDGAVIAGATATTFKVTAADYGKLVKARVTVAKSNYNSFVADSVAKNYSVTASGAPVITGTAKVGRVLTAQNVTYSTSAGAVASPTRTYQWLRAGVAIAGATAASYTLVAADYNTLISVRVTGATPNFLTATGTSVATAAVAKGDIQASGTPVVTVAPTLIATVAMPAGSVTETGVAYAYQWLRDGVAISGATAATFQLTAADYGKTITARVTLSKPNYTSAPFESAGKNYSTTAAGVPVISGTTKVGQVLTASTVAYSTVDGAVASPVRAHQWLRDGVAIAGATSATYALVAADFGKAITVRVTGSTPGFLPIAATTAATALIAKGDVQAAGTPVVTVAPSLVATVAMPSGGVQEAGVAYAYQWFRNGVAISGATAATFQLTAADYGKLVKARITVTKLNYTTVAFESVEKNYSTTADGVPVISGVAKVGQLLSASTVGYSTTDGGILSPVRAYQWLRAGVAITGATSATYALVAADFGKAITVRVTGSTPGFLPIAGTTAATALIAKGDIQASGTPVVTVDNALLATVALPAGSVTETGVAYTYQWYRNGVAITGATAATFKLTAADYDKLVKARVTITKLNYTTVAFDSVESNHSTIATGTATVSGVVRVGEVLTAVPAEYSTDQGPLVSPVLSYQWYSNGVAIANAKFATYALVAADYTKRITVTITASTPTYIGRSLTSAPSVPVALGVLAGDYAVPTVDKSPTLKLTAALPPGSITTTGTSTAYQWFRGTVAITGATASSYQLVAADFGADVRVRFIISKPNFTSVTLNSTPTNYSVVPSPARPSFAGDIAVDRPLNAVLRSYTAGGEVVIPTVAHQWLRDGVAIAGATSASYTLLPADLGKAISLRETVTYPGFLSSVGTSVATQKVGTYFFADAADLPQVTTVAEVPLTLSASKSVGEELPAPVTAYAFQWLRNGMAIALATAQTYKPVAADYGTTLSVRVTATRAAFTPVVAESTAKNYSTLTEGLPAIDGALAVGRVLTASPSTYSTVDGPAAAPVITYQWLRNGVAIAGATAATYELVAADFATKTSVRLTAREPGFLPVTSTSPATVAIAKGEILGSGDDPVVNKDAALKLTVALPPGSVTTPGTALAYQWFRAGVAIPLATTASFQLTAADYNKQISVRVIVSKLNYTSVTEFSSEQNYSTLTDGLPAMSGPLAVGRVLTANLAAYSTPQGPALAPVVTYQWLRNGVAIAGATAANYELVAADYNTKTSLRVIAREPGYLPVTSTSLATTAIGKGELGSLVAPVVTASPTAKLTVAPPAGIATSAPIFTYQWFRNGVAITGATAPAYQLVAADYGKLIKARVVVSKLNYTSITIDSAEVNHSVVPSAALPAIVGDAVANRTLTVAPRTYLADGLEATPTLGYQWLRDGVVIAGATESQYTTVLADIGKAISVRVTASYPGFLPAIATSIATPKVVVDTLPNAAAAPTIAKLDDASLLLTAVPGAGTPGQTTYAYQWFAAGVAVAAATAPTFTPLAAHYDKAITVRVTASQASFATIVATSATTGVSVTAVGLPQVSDSTPVALDVLSVVLPEYSVAISEHSYRWLRNGVAIAGQTASTYSVLPTDVGATISVEVTPVRPGLLVKALVSVPTAAVAAA